jgi:hypothetical protein
MGYFEGLAAASFKSDKQGNRLFYKWGVLGNAYILPDKQKEDEIKNFVILFHKVSLISIIGVGVAFSWLLAIVITIPLFIWFWIKTKSLTQDLNISTEKLTLKESYGNSAQNYSTGTLWFMLISSLLFVLGGSFMIIRSRNSTDILMGAIGILFFGAGLIISIYMLSRKRN